MKKPKRTPDYTYRDHWEFYWKEKVMAKRGVISEVRTFIIHRNKIYVDRISDGTKCFEEIQYAYKQWKLEQDYKKKLEGLL